MFNQSSAFNRAPFNRPFSVEILLSVTLDGQGTAAASLNRDTVMASELTGIAEVIGDLIQGVLFAAQVDGIGSVSGELLRERILSAALDAGGTLLANMSRFHVEEIQISSPIVPGDKVVIDAKKLRASKNGEPVGYTGDFFDIHPGQNELTITDQSSGRTIQIRVTHRDKYLY
ncbi:phage distal tail protein [Cohnella kolymensis]|uniref:phage distal tail protein n=1 Tax=Cohnella kolymensis TaxID=1590652 RepID=UPI000698D986|nr:hypothetical protein [Cohnella kolymensis]